MAQARRNSSAPRDLDSPTIHLSAADLDKEAGSDQAPEPYVYRTRTGKRVTFPDPYEMGFEEAEKFLDEIQAFGNSADSLKRWVGLDGLDAIRKDKLTLRQMLLLVERVQQHYLSFMGTPGEGAPSSS